MGLFGKSKWEKSADEFNSWAAQEVRRKQAEMDREPVLDLRSDDEKDKDRRR